MKFAKLLNEADNFNDPGIRMIYAMGFVVT